MEYAFNLKFRLPSTDLSENELMNRLEEYGCADALVGMGLPGYVSLDFIRDAANQETAILTATNQVKRAVPGCLLVCQFPRKRGK